MRLASGDVPWEARMAAVSNDRPEVHKEVFRAVTRVHGLEHEMRR